MNKNELHNVAESHENGIDFHEVSHLFRVNKWLLLIIFTISMALAAFYVKKHVPTYQADVLFQVDTNVSGNGVMDILSTTHNANDSVDTQIALLKSRFIFNQVVDELGLDISAEPQKVSTIKSFFSFSTNKNSDSIDIYKFNIPKNLLNKKFKIMLKSKDEITLTDSSGKEVLRGSIGKLLRNKDRNIELFVNSISAKIGTSFSLVKNSRSAVVSSLLPRLRVIEERGTGMRSSTGILSMSLIGTDPRKIVDTLNVAVDIAKKQDAKKKAAEASQTLLFLKKQLPITKQELLDAEYKLNEFRSKTGKLDLKFQTQYLLEQFLGFDKKLEELRLEKNNLLKRYTENHPLYATITSDIKTVKDQRKKLELTLKKLPKSEQKNVNLVRDVEVKQTLYLLLLNKIQELEVVKAGTISGVRILSRAYLPEAPLPQKKSPIYVGFGITGIFLFLGIVFGRKAISAKVKDPHLLEKIFGLPTLAILPFSRENLTKNDNKRVYSLIARDNPKNLTVEALRSLRTSLQVSLPSAQNNIVSILGLCPGVGKSFVASNFAYLLASARKKVIVIDCDLRAGALHKYFGVSSAVGMVEVLKGDVNLVDAIKQSQFSENLYYLTRGSFPKDPSELLMGPNLKNILDILSEEFDLVIIDTPPVLLVTDAVIVSRFSSLNYMVIAADEHYPADIEKTLKILRTAQITLKGYIYNYHKLQKRFHGDLYGYRYNSKYYYESYGHYQQQSQKV